MNKSENPWLIFAVGCLLTGGSIYGLLTIDDGFEWRGVYIPIWTDWFLLFCGILILILSIRAIRRGEGKPKVYTTEDAARAEAEMDAMYLREHGEPPEKPEKQD